MSDFYWESLGIPYYSITKTAVSNRLEDFRNFLRRAIKSLERASYYFEFNSYTKLTLDAKDLVNLPEHPVLCSDKEFSRVIFNGELSRGQKRLIIPGIHKFSRLFVKGTDMKVGVRGFSFMLNDIRPVKVPEEVENLALDALFEGRNIYHGEPSRRNQLQVTRKDRNKLELEVEEPDVDIIPGEHLIVVYNTYNLSMQKDALERLMNEPQKHMIPLINLMQYRKFAKWQDFENELRYRNGVLMGHTSPGTREQMEFVKIALGTTDFAILEGPPGSGKTSTLLEIILNLCATGKKVLMVASTHVAVDNILERLSESNNGNENLMEKFGVIPLRIGDEESVSEKVRDFTISKRIGAEKARIKTFLGSKQFLSEAQRTLLSALDSDRENAIEQLVIDSSNFICGTTIGILQSELIKANRRSGSECPFDYMILDEASKTTFTEFLVPALFARRWIISGDPKQLSPYVDQEFIEKIVSNLPSFGRMNKEDIDIVKNVSVDIFNSTEVNPSPKLRGALVIGGKSDSISEKYVSQANHVSKRIEKSGRVSPLLFDLWDAGSSSNSYRLLGSRLVIGDRGQVDKHWKSIPPGLALRGEVPVNIKRRDAAVLDTEDLEKDSGNWDYQISWRLNRAYEMRNDLKSKKYLDELNLLVPYFLDGDGEEERFILSKGVCRDLRKIRKTLYPSIIEMLQCGVGDASNEDEEETIALYGGLPPEVLSRRHVLLTYQHRMHPDISKYARSYFYEDKALLDSPELRKTREWSYETHYKRRLVWIDRKTGNRNIQERAGTNVNLLEVDIIREELESFMSWAKANRKADNEPWKVAVLTFYRGQEKALSKMMQELSGLRNNRRYFNLSSRDVDVEVCTVDRFQGQEADLVFLSMVRRRGVGFLDNRNRMNVALTRAKYQTVIVGDKIPFRKNKTEFLHRMAEEMEGPI